MENIINLTQKQLADFLLHVAIVRPVFIWGAPGIGKSSLVEQFADSVGLPCVSLLGSQLAPEDLIGVPKIEGDVSQFCPPRNIARKEPYCLFLDELNACSHEVQKAFYSLIHERRIGEYHLPEGSVVIGAGNRSQDSAIVKPLSSALINRMVHVQLKASTRDWLDWAYEQTIHPHVLEYIQARPDHLWSQPPKQEEPFSTPRSWHMLSDILYEYGDDISPEVLESIAYGCLTPAHATQFRAFIKNIQNRYQLENILAGEARWPYAPEERDILYFLAESFRARLLKELPLEKEKLSATQRDLAYRGKELLTELAGISLEIAQMVISEQAKQSLPSWFLVEVFRDLPRLVQRKG